MFWGEGGGGLGLFGDAGGVVSSAGVQGGCVCGRGAGGLPYDQIWGPAGAWGLQHSQTLGTGRSTGHACSWDLQMHGAC